jgi:hypothetical protein
MSTGNQTMILKNGGQLEEAFELLKKQNALCLEVGSRAFWVTAAVTGAFSCANSVIATRSVKSWLPPFKHLPS